MRWLLEFAVEISTACGRDQNLDLTTDGEPALGALLGGVLTGEFAVLVGLVVIDEDRQRLDAG